MVNDFMIKPLKIERGNSTVYNINYHIVFCPKYRKKVLKDEIKEELNTIFRTICLSNDWNLIELTIMEDHIHIFVSCHPKNSPVEIVKKLKGISSKLIFKKFPEFKEKEYWGKHLWSEGYYVGTAGVVTSEAIQKYIVANSSNH